MSSQNNIFSVENITNKFYSICKKVGTVCNQAKDYATSPQTIQKLNQCAQKAKSFIIQNDKILIGVGVVGALYWWISRKQKPANSELKKSRKPKNYVKLNNLKSFISEDQQISQIQKDQHNQSTCKSRTEETSDIEPKKKRRQNLEPIIDLAEEDEQTEDRVFFQMYKTYMQS